MTEKSSAFRNLRLRLGLTQAKMAEKFKITRTYYVEIEAGRKKPSATLAEMLQLIEKAADLEDHIEKSESEAASETSTQSTIDLTRFWSDRFYRMDCLLDHFGIPEDKRPTSQELVPRAQAIAALTGLTLEMVTGMGASLDPDYRCLADLKAFMPLDQFPPEDEENRRTATNLNNRIQHYIDNPDYAEQLSAEEARDRALGMAAQMAEESVVRYGSKDNPVYKEVYNEIMAQLQPWLDKAKSDPRKAVVMLHLLRKHLPLEDLEL